MLEQIYIYIYIYTPDFHMFCNIVLHLGGLGSMENTPMVRADDLPSILAIFKNNPNSRSVNKSLQQLDFDPNSIKDCVCQPKLRPVKHRPKLHKSMLSASRTSQLPYFKAACCCDIHSYGGFF